MITLFDVKVAFNVHNCLFWSNDVFSPRRELAATVCWAPRPCPMLAGCVKETTPPARSTKDSTPSSIIPTVSQRTLESKGFVHWFEIFYKLLCPFPPSIVFWLIHKTIFCGFGFTVHVSKRNIFAMVAIACADSFKGFVFCQSTMGW